MVSSSLMMTDSTTSLRRNPPGTCSKVLHNITLHNKLTMKHGYLNDQSTDKKKI